MRVTEGMLRVMAVAAGMLMACPGPVPQVPGKGGPPWIELTSPHFTIWTDADPVRVRDLVRKMERLQQFVVGAVLPTALREGRDFAIVMRDDAELRAFSDTEQARPFATQARFPLWQPTIVLSATIPPGDLEVALAHELIHAISYGVIHHQPRWFAEGMATYFETVGLDPKLETVNIGGPPTGRPVRIAHLMPISELFGWGKGSREETRQYITAWALFWFLINQHRDELVHYMYLIDTADAEDAEIERRSDLAKHTWDQAFPTLPLTTVDRQLRDWLFNGTHQEKQFRFEAHEVSVTQRLLGDADVYAVRGWLHTLAGKRDAQARADVARALAAEPTNVLARLLAAGLDDTEISADEARAIATAHQDDWRAWMLVAGAAHGTRGEAEAARVRACELASANPALLPPPELCPEHRTAQSSR